MADQTSAIKDIRSAVEAGLSAAQPNLKDKVVASLVDAELSKRAELIVKGVGTFRQAEMEVRKINKPDNVSYNADGTVAQQTFSKATLEAVKKAQERVNKIDNALNKAISDADFKLLEEVVKGGNKQEEAPAA